MPELSYALDTLFTLFAMTLIIFMVPGFAMLEAGLVRSKNVAAVLTVNTLIYAIASMAFLLVGYTLAFGSWENDAMSKWAAFLFQMAFVGKTVNIMSGGVSERVRIVPLMLFAVVMAALLYPIAVNLTWGANLLKDTALDISAMHDLAGSTVIHSTGAWALLAAIIIIGPRKGRYGKNGAIRVFPASNIPLVTLGAMLLWIGWFGFNGGSVGSISSKESADAVALTIMNTNTAGLAGAIIVALIEHLRYKRFDITMILNGALGGLVAITAGADLFDIYAPIVIGAIGGIIVLIGVPLFDRLHLDDPVGALSVHLLNGIWGTLAVALFADVSFVDQLKGVAIIAIFAFTGSYVALFVINKIIPFRADEEAEQEGLDITECGLESYPEFTRTI